MSSQFGLISNWTISCYLWVVKSMFVIGFSKLVNVAFCCTCSVVYSTLLHLWDEVQREVSSRGNFIGPEREEEGQRKKGRRQRGDYEQVPL